MITIIHGEETVSSRMYFQDEKKKTKNPLSLDGKTLTITDLAQALGSYSLFSDTKTLFIEDIFVKPASKEQASLLEYLNNATNTNIFIWEGKEITKKQASLLKKPITKLFNPPKEIFTFLDSLQVNNKNNVAIFHNVIQQEDVGFVFFMLIRHFRLLLAVCANGNNLIDEAKRLAPWQKGKLKKQALLLSLDTLKKAQQKLYEIDLSQKTGGTPLSLTQAVDFFLLDL